MREFLVNGNCGVERRTFGPLDTAEALRKAATMRSEGYALITLTDVATGVELDIERFMTGNPSAEQ